jgi:tight adherence protein C
MDTRWIFALVAGFLFLAVFLSGYAVLMTRPNIEERLRGGRVQKRSFDFLKMVRRSEKVLKPLGEMIPRSPEEMTRQERKLAQAGIRRRDGPYILYGVKVSLCVVLFLGFAMIGPMRSHLVLLVPVSILLGAMIPDIIVSRLVKKRKDSIQRSLPDALDLAVVSVEAGLGLDQSLIRIGQELKKVYPALSDELNLYSLEVNAGRKRADALRNLGRRTDVDDLKSFVTVLIQSATFGTSVAQSSGCLRTACARNDDSAGGVCRQDEHQNDPAAGLFHFPAMLTVILGPAIIVIIRYLFPMLAGEPRPQ